jgi:hypothetical protein
MPEPLTPDQRIALIEQHDRSEGARRQRTLWMTWASVAAAAVVLALIVFSAGRQLAQVQDALTRARTEQAQVETDIQQLNSSKARIEAQLKENQAALSASLGTLGRVSDVARQTAIEQQMTDDPKTALLLPRVYLHVVDPADRAWAVEVSRTLEAAGMIALGVRYVPNAAGLKTTDVRYYKKSEEPGAARIVEILKASGVTARLNYLNMENNTKVRPNHFEVWFAANAHTRPVT